jgi:hypothetical protein
MMTRPNDGSGYIAVTIRPIDLPTDEAFRAALGFALFVALANIIAGAAPHKSTSS